MPADALLREIQGFCRRTGIAESTFGRLAVNDGKLAARLRAGAGVTPATREKVQAYIRDHAVPQPDAAMAIPAAAGDVAAAELRSGFRFFDNRQKYLLFVTSSSEKAVIANRIAGELAHIAPRPPALRLFDAGAGDGTVLARVMRATHATFPEAPLYVVGKEISWEDVRLTLDKLPDRFAEHPATVVVLTNLTYAEAPWLTPGASRAKNLVWKDVALSGNSARAFEQQINELEPLLSDVWRARVSPESGVPVYDRPVVLVLYRADQRFVLEPVIPRQGRAQADFDLVLASQPYSARSSEAFKVRRVLAPLARALGPAGRLVGIHSYGHDPGMEIIHGVWPGLSPFRDDRHSLLKALRKEFGDAARDFQFHAGADARAVFRYDLNILPGELAGEIGTSTLLAAWNAAIYAAQIEDDLLAEVVRDGRYVAATATVLRKHGALWFNDEQFVVVRRR
ncbi:MAG: hypothetical protein ACWA6X_11680 [Bauldia sp.]